MLARWTILGTLGCVAVSLAYNWLFFRDMGGAALRQGLVSATVLPVLLAGPLFFYLTLKLRELAIANHKLASMATTDSLTDCLNRGAFTTFVEARLAHESKKGRKARGALLVIDADHFKTINDRYGHHTGDQALRLIARTINSVLRAEDLAGRLGGEEFGVFLPGASEMHATAIAERICSVVSETPFMPEDRRCVLSVSVGCAAFDGPIDFSELFRIADERLYAAKNAGRNRVMASCAPKPADAGLRAPALH